MNLIITDTLLTCTLLLCPVGDQTYQVLLYIVIRYICMRFLHIFLYVEIIGGIILHRNIIYDKIIETYEKRAYNLDLISLGQASHLQEKDNVQIKTNKTIL